MEAVDAGRDRVKVTAAWVGEKAGRLKPNGQLTGYSPLSRVVELEGLSLGIEGKRLLWVSLGTRRRPPLGGVRLRSAGRAGGAPAGGDRAAAARRGGHGGGAGQERLRPRLARRGHRPDTGRMASMGAAAAAVIVFGTIALPGCGGSGGEDPEPRADVQARAPRRGGPAASPARPSPRRSRRSPSAVGAQSCRAYQPLRSSFIRHRPPGSRRHHRRMRPRRRGLAALRGYAVDRAAQFKTGALMEGPAAGGGRQWTIWVLDGDGRFRFTGVSGATAQVGTPLGKRTEAETVAAAFVRSIRRRDCAAMQPLFSPAGSRLVTSSRAARGRLAARCCAAGSSRPRCARRPAFARSCSAAPRTWPSSVSPPAHLLHAHARRPGLTHPARGRRAAQHPGRPEGVAA